ncbi:MULTISPECIES: tyrosine-type recombinase/integrase [Bacillaceae]|uniref:Site-specific integrase n=1 Tax=Mesobacillus maritimus TaxID=1643336 RepID=A0ABS7K8T4_9BACI|nr:MULTISPECIES: site-specific integrase [Bacillaceae]MBY0098683.1 site-specific integrase [Mesobacillus maritimus]MEC0666141.1 site-specific integrase [Priestia flexa]
MKGSVSKRGSTWTYVVDIGKDPETGKRQQKTKGGFKKKKDAEAALLNILKELEEGEYIEPSNKIFSSYIEEWFQHYGKRVKETTAFSRRFTVDKHLIRENPFHNKPLSKITSKDIDNLYNLKLDEGYSTNTIRKIHQMLHQALEQAVKWNMIKTNPVSKTAPPSIKTKDFKIWSFDEVHAFLEVSRKNRHYIMFLLAIYTGMRKGEILGLKWSDIDFEKKVIMVQRSVARISGLGYIFSSPKTKKSIRQVPIPDFFIEELLTHKKTQEEWKKRSGTQYQELDLVISTETGTIQDPRNVLREMRKICKNAKVTPIRFHDIRHTHASILIAEGVDIVKVASRLGHTNPKITLEIYAHLMPNEDNDVADIFHKAFKKSR